MKEEKEYEKIKELEEQLYRLKSGSVIYTILEQLDKLTKETAGFRCYKEELMELGEERYRSKQK